MPAKPKLQSKTLMTFGGLAAGAALVLLEMLADPAVRAAIPAAYLPATVIVMAVIGVGLRLYTGQPVKGSPAETEVVAAVETLAEQVLLARTATPTVEVEGAPV